MIQKKNIDKIFYLFLFSHLLVWTLIPSLSNTNLPLDTIEALAWGSNLDWGFSKHPPLSAFAVEFFFRIFGNNDWAYYLLSQIFVLISFFFVWKLSNEILENKTYSLLSILLLEGIYFYNFTTPEFNVNVSQLPFWTLSVYFFWKSLNFNKNIDWIFHLAAKADIVPSIEEPRGYFDTNVMGTLNVIEGCRNIKIKKFIYIASSTCYGIPKRYPTNESSKIITKFPYALTKYFGEQLVLHWGEIYRIPVVSLRCFNIYGTRSRTSGAYGAVIGVFLAQKLKKKPLTIVGDGKQKRDFTFVKDVVDAIIKTAKSKKKITFIM